MTNTAAFAPTKITTTRPCACPPETCRHRTCECRPWTSDARLDLCRHPKHPVVEQRWAVDGPHGRSTVTFATKREAAESLVCAASGTWSGVHCSPSRMSRPYAKCECGWHGAVTASGNFPKHKRAEVDQ